MKQCWIQYIEKNTKNTPVYFNNKYTVRISSEISRRNFDKWVGNMPAGRCGHAARDSGVPASSEAGSGRPFPNGTGAEKTAREDGRIAWEDDRFAGEDDRIPGEDDRIVGEDDEIVGEDNRIVCFEQH